MEVPKTNSLTRELVAIDQHVEQLEAQLHAATSRRKEIVEHELVQAMRQEQLTKFSTNVGNRHYDVGIKHKIVGSLSRAEDIAEALHYLEEKGFKGATKATVSLTVDDHNRANVVEALLEFPGSPKIERKINHNTLAAFARECINNGEGFDLDKVGLTALTEATIKEEK